MAAEEPGPCSDRLVKTDQQRGRHLALLCCPKQGEAPYKRMISVSASAWNTKVAFGIILYFRYFNGLYQAT